VHNLVAATARAPKERYLLAVQRMPAILNRYRTRTVC